MAEQPHPRLVSHPPPAPQRPLTAHKHMTGRVGIFAGSPGMAGAAVLCGRGALRGGAGLVRVWCDAAVQPTVAVSEPCLMTAVLPPADDDAFPDALDEALRWSTALAIGPGLGRSNGAQQLTRHLLSGARVPLVLDADGFAVLESDGPPALPPTSGQTLPIVLTPHAGEMARLRAGAGLPPQAEQSDAARLRSAHEYAALTRTILVLKGYRTVVCDATRAYVNETGNPGMASGGMGDVLTGLIAALLAQNMTPFDAACLGVHVHGLAGDLLARRVGPVGYLAREVADVLPEALAQAGMPRMGFC